MRLFCPLLLPRLSGLYPLLLLSNKRLNSPHRHPLRCTHHQLTSTYHLESKGLSFRTDELVVFSHKKAFFITNALTSGRWVALAPGGCHATSSKLNSSLASTAKSLFFCGRARKINSGFSVPPTGGSKINRVGGNGRMLVPLSETYART